MNTFPETKSRSNYNSIQMKLTYIYYTLITKIQKIYLKVFDLAIDAINRQIMFTFNVNV